MKLRPTSARGLTGCRGLGCTGSRTDAPSVRSFDQVAAADVEQFKKFFHGMLDEGVYLAPSAFEAGFVSAAHGDDEINASIAAAGKVFRTM